MTNKLKNFKKIILIIIFFTFVGVSSIFATSHETISVITQPASKVESRSVNLKGNVGETITTKGFVYSTSKTNLIIDGAGVTNSVVTGTTAGDFSKTISGLTASTKYYYKAYAINSGGTKYGDLLNFMTLETMIVGDITYDTSKVGNLLWTSENLRHGTGDGVYSYDDNVANDANGYGKLYTWAAAMAGSTNEGAQGICATGWRIPTKADSDALLSSPDKNNPFAGPLAGQFSDSYIGRDSYLLVWLSTGYDHNNHLARIIQGSSSEPISAGGYAPNKSDKFSVRCVKNVPLALPVISISNINATSGVEINPVIINQGSGGMVESFRISPTLTNGFFLDSTTGTITGKPFQYAPSKTYTITAQNSAGSITTTFNIVVKLGSGTFETQSQSIDGSSISILGYVPNRNVKVELFLKERLVGPGEGSLLITTGTLISTVQTSDSNSFKFDNVSLFLGANNFFVKVSKTITTPAVPAVPATSTTPEIEAIPATSIEVFAEESSDIIITRTTQTQVSNKPGKVTSVVAKYRSRGSPRPEIRWERPSDTAVGIIKGYEIQHRLSSASSFSDTDIILFVPNVLENGGFKKTLGSVSGATESTYRVRAYNTVSGARVNGDWSESVIISSSGRFSSTEPSEVINLAANIVANKVVLSWEVPTTTGFGLSGYEIYRDDNTSTAYEIIYGNILSYTDPLPLPGAHTYKVSAFNLFSSGDSSSVIATLVNSSSPVVLFRLNKPEGEVIYDNVTLLSRDVLNLVSFVTDEDENDTFTYLWEAISTVGEPGTFDDSTEATTTYRAPYLREGSKNIFLKLTVTDLGGNEVSATRSITVQSKPVFLDRSFWSDKALSIKLNELFTYALPTAVGGLSPITYSLLSEEQGTASLPVGIDFNLLDVSIHGIATEITPSSRFLLKATDAMGSVGYLSLGIVVPGLPLSAGPSIVGGDIFSISHNELRTFVRDISLHNSNNNAVTFSLVTNHQDSSKFHITSTGRLTFITAPDFENPTDTDSNNEYIVTVTASHGTLTDTQEIRVTVTDIDIIATPVSAITDGVGGFTKLNGAWDITTTKIGTETYVLVTSYNDDSVQIIDITTPTLPTSVSVITDGVGGFTELDGARGITSIKIGTKTYALVASNADDGVQIIDITDPTTPTFVSAITDGVGGFTQLDGANDITTTIIGTKTYALVASSNDDGVQIIDITNPITPTPVSAITDGDVDSNENTYTKLDGARGITTTKIETKTYALVASSTDDGVQIIDITNPASPTFVSAITDGVGGFTKLNSAWDITTTKIETKTYALVTSSADDGVQIIDITNPASPTPVSAITDGEVFTELDSARGITTTKIGTKTYALVTSFLDDGVQIIDITNPASPTPVSAITDGVGGFTELDGANSITTTKIGTKTYALVSSSADGVQIIELTPETPPSTSLDVDGDGIISESDIRALFFRAQLASFAAFDYLGKTNSRSIELETQYQNILNSPLLDINGDDLTDESEIRTFFFRAQLASFAAFDYLGKTNSRSIELENQYNDILD